MSHAALEHKECGWVLQHVKHGWLEHILGQMDKAYICDGKE